MTKAIDNIAESPKRIAAVAVVFGLLSVAAIGVAVVTLVEGERTQGQVREIARDVVRVERKTLEPSVDELRERIVRALGTCAASPECRRRFTALAPRGRRGVPGERGPRGRPGRRGPAGPRGAIGPRGATGRRGSAGPVGASGRPGQTGSRGATGAGGSRGSRGASGRPGPRGLSRLRELPGDLPGLRSLPLP